MARHVRPRARARRRLLLLSLLLVLAGALVLGAAVVARPDPTGASRSTGPGTPSPRSAGAEITTDWFDVLAGLDASRAEAFRAGDPATLTEVYTGGSDALAADRRLLRRYARRGLRVHGLRMEVVDLRLVGHTPGRATLRVRDRVGAGHVVDAEGRRTRLPADGFSEHRIVLVRTDTGWRIRSVAVADRSPPVTAPRR